MPTPRPEDFLWRADAPARPVPLARLVEQYDALSVRDLVSRYPAEARAVLAAAGRPVEPLSVADHLAVLALTAAIEMRARQFRGVEMDTALRAGAGWPDVAAALGWTVAAAKRRYREWADGQHGLWRASPPGSIRSGLDDDAYAAALARLEDGGEVSDGE